MSRAMPFANPAERRDRNIRFTDFDALGSRLAAVTKQYYEDPYVASLVNGVNANLTRFMTGPSLGTKRALSQNFSEQAIASKFPIINRGTYIRTVLIDKIVGQFLQQFHSDDSNTEETKNSCQIISIGAGSDTRPFKLLSQYRRLNYIETDFPDSTRLKSTVIITNPELDNIIFDEKDEKVQAAKRSLQHTFENDIGNYPSALHAANYHLLPVDLRNMDELKNLLDHESVDLLLPTLLISECVLCYIEPLLTNEIISRFTQKLPKGLIVIYEPMSLNDNFGDVMIGNLQARGISIPTLKAFPNVEAQHKRLSQIFSQQNKQHHNVFVGDINHVYNQWVSGEEALRITKLELVDELEEWILLSKHYSLLVGIWWDEFGDQGFPQLVKSLAAFGWQI